jgi:hypothetical protein
VPSLSHKKRRKKVSKTGITVSS